MFLTYLFIVLACLYAGYFLFKFVKLFVKNFKKRYDKIKASRAGSDASTNEVSKDD